MAAQKIILYILGLVVVGGLVFVATKSSNQTNPSNPANPSAGFSKTVTLSLNEKITFSDGLMVVLKAINDSRCAKGEQCIWAGELSAELQISGGKVASGEVIHLGTTNNKSTTSNGYTFSLKDATTTSATIAVVKN